MDERPYLKALVKQAGGIKAAAEKWGLPYPTLASLMNGYRGISPKMAQRIAAADPMADAKRLVWVRPTQSENSAA
jgi:plasmid maintenance system antidote protein VapI